MRVYMDFQCKLISQLDYRSGSFESVLQKFVLFLGKNAFARRPENFLERKNYTITPLHN